MSCVPARARLSAMGCPMTPKPMKPMSKFTSIPPRLARVATRSVSTRILFAARHHHVHDMHQHGLVVLVQCGRAELDQALLRTGL